MKQKGISLLESVTALAVIAIIVGAAAPLSITFLDNRREAETLDQLETFKRAIIGDPRIISSEARTSFGYLGDLGNLPASLTDLWINGTQPAFAFDSTLKTGVGWAGPYLNTQVLEFLNQIALDSWGNPIDWTRPDDSSGAIGKTVKGRLVSPGPNKILGDSDDLKVEIFDTETLSKVIGFVRDASGNLMPGATVEINYPLNGVLTTQTLQTGINGDYIFDGIPFGVRSITVKPRLVAVPDSAVTTGGGGDNVEVLIQNFSAADIILSSLTIIYEAVAFYEMVKLDGQVVFNSNNPRGASGQFIDFSGNPFTVTGTGQISGESFPVRIQSPVTQVADLNIGLAAKKGGTFKLKIEKFRDLQSGAAAAVDMTGISFQIDFSDGSTVFFTPIRK
ncbi:MAG: hypothetical protein ACRD1R_06015 [Acidobacteriota bacterium]